MDGLCRQRLCESAIQSRQGSGIRGTVQESTTEQFCLERGTEDALGNQELQPSRCREEAAGTPSVVAGGGAWPEPLPVGLGALLSHTCVLLVWWVFFQNPSVLRERTGGGCGVGEPRSGSG